MNELCENCSIGYYHPSGHCDHCNLMRERGNDTGEALNALRMLFDVQNGCPLPSYEKDWNKAMAKAVKVLEKYGN